MSFDGITARALAALGLKAPDPYEASIRVCELAKEGRCHPGAIEQAWREAFGAAARHLGFTRKDASLLWGELACGDWDRLHLTEAEQGKPASDWLDGFASEVFYCSDRWSLDRLARAHWAFRMYMAASRPEKTTERQG